MTIALSEFVGFSTTPSAFGSGDNTQKIHRVYFKVTASGSYAGAPGDPMDFTTLGDMVKSSYAPLFCMIESYKPGGTSGYQYQYVPNASNPSVSNGFFQVLKAPGATGPQVDIGAGAYAAGITGDTIIGFADFVRT